MNTIANVRNAYWDYVFAVQSVDVARQSLVLAEELLRNNQTKVEIGTMAPIDVVQAQSQVAQQRQTLVTAEGTRLRLRTLRPGVVVGEIALYTGVARTADVVAEVPSVVLRISRASIERLEAEEPELAASLHRWLAAMLAERLTDTMRTFDVLLD